MTERLTFGEGRTLTLSVGVAPYRKGMDVSRLVSAAYGSMVEAKREGGNRVVLAREMKK
jgi:PleD family two-component response regulator